MDWKSVVATYCYRSHFADLQTNCFGNDYSAATGNTVSSCSSATHGGATPSCGKHITLPSPTTRAATVVPAGAAVHYYEDGVDGANGFSPARRIGLCKNFAGVTFCNSVHLSSISQAVSQSLGRTRPAAAASSCVHAHVIRLWVGHRSTTRLPRLSPSAYIPRSAPVTMQRPACTRSLTCATRSKSREWPCPS